MRGRSGRSDRTTGAYRKGKKGSGPEGLLPLEGTVPKCRIGPRRPLARGEHPTKKGPGRSNGPSGDESNSGWGDLPSALGFGDVPQWLVR